MAGRKSIKGRPRKYILTDNAADYVRDKGGSKWLNDTLETLRAINK